MLQLRALGTGGGGGGGGVLRIYASVGHRIVRFPAPIDVRMWQARTVAMDFHTGGARFRCKQAVPDRIT